MSSSSRSRSKKEPVKKKKQKTSTPSRSRIEQYVSLGNISKVFGSPIQQQRTVLDSMSEIERSGEGQRLTDGEGQRSSESLSDGDTNTRTRSRLMRQDGQGDASSKKSSRKSQSAVASEEDAEELSQEVLQETVIDTPVTRRRRKNSTLKNATIDKFMSPDRSNSVISTPTKFPKLGSKSANDGKSRSTLENATINKFMSPDRSNSVISTPTIFPRLKSKSANDGKSRSSRSGEESSQGLSKRSGGNGSSSQSEEDTGGSRLRSNVDTRSRRSSPSLEDMPSTSTGIYHTQADAKGTCRAPSMISCLQSVRFQVGSDVNTILQSLCMHACSCTLLSHVCM